MNSEPAFPCTNEQLTHGNPQTGDAWPGMSLRDWFAGQALNARLHSGLVGMSDAATMARKAYVFADAMLAARAEGKAS